jgi:hypothetical protein
MHAAGLDAAIYAMTKHKIGGIVAIIIGAVLLVVGALRVMRRMAGAMVLALIGVAIVIIGILLYAHVIKS